MILFSSDEGRTWFAPTLAAQSPGSATPRRPPPELTLPVPLARPPSRKEQTQVPFQYYAVYDPLAQGGTAFYGTQAVQALNCLGTNVRRCLLLPSPAESLRGPHRSGPAAPPAPRRSICRLCLRLRVSPSQLSSSLTGTDNSPRPHLPAPFSAANPVRLRGQPAGEPAVLRDSGDVLGVRAAPDGRRLLLPDAAERAVD